MVRRMSQAVVEMEGLANRETRLSELHAFNEAWTLASQETSHLSTEVVTTHTVGGLRQH